MKKLQKARQKDKKKKAKVSKPSEHPMQIQIAGIIGRVKNEAKEAQKNTQLIGEKLQYIIDEADVTLPLLANLDPQYYESLVNIWTSTSHQVSRTNANLREIRLSTDSASGTASISSSIISGAYVNNGFRHVEGLEFTMPWANFEAFASRSSLKADVIHLLYEYRFETPQIPGNKSPLEQFETAHESFQNPSIESNPVSTSLIPMRECIDSIIASLLKLRPSQEEAKNERTKIISIGLQLKKDSLPQTAIDELADEWHSLNNDLSGFKKKDVQRDHWLAQLNRGTSFLYSLLNGLDSKKLKR